MHCSNCENDARYVREDGKLTCALHAMGFVALRVSDLAEVVANVRAVCDALKTFEEFNRYAICSQEASRLRVLLGILPTNVRPSS